MAGVLDSSEDEAMEEPQQHLQPMHSVGLPEDLQASATGYILALGTSNTEVYVGFFSFLKLG